MPKTPDTQILVDGTLYTKQDRPILDHWQTTAAEKGFVVVARARDRYTLVVRCRACDQLSLKKRNVVVDHNPDCHICIRTRRETATASLGATCLGPDPQGNRHYGVFKLACGHIVRRQFERVEDAAAGGDALGCETCLEQRYADEASKIGWNLVGPASDGRAGYRQYQHDCDHLQNITVGNMFWGDCDCAGCGESYTSKPSKIYLFAIDLPGLPVLKLGYSSTPDKRLRHQLGITAGTQTQILREVSMPTGHLAELEERTAHRILLLQHPDWIIPKAIFGERINTQGEIYHPAASATILDLLDAIAQRYPQTAV